MWIKKPEKKSFTFLKLLRSKKFIIPAALFITLSFYTLVIFFAGTKKDELRRILPVQLKIMLKESIFYQYFTAEKKVNIPFNFLKGLTVRKDPIFLNIKFKQIRKLEKNRQDAIDSYFLQPDDKQFINAEINKKDKKFKAKIRLKGDWPSHWAGYKWSLRAKLADGETFEGMKSFSLQKPETRNYLHAWVFHKLLESENLPRIRYSFSPLILNGNHLGTYAIEEHFEKTMIESSRYKEGPIIKFSDQHFWEEFKTTKSLDGEAVYPKHKEPAIFGSSIEVFKERRIIKDENLKNQMIKAKHLLSIFLEGNEKISKTFDVEKLAKSLALIDLTNADHSFLWHNQRFYYNPISSRLIPVLFDGNSGEKLKKLMIEKNFYYKLFEDHELVREYVRFLEYFSNPQYLDKFFIKNKEQLTYYEKLLYKSYPAMYFSEGNYYYNQKVIKSVLNPSNPIEANIQEFNKDNTIIKVSNKQILPIKIIGVFEKEKLIYKPKDELVIKAKRKNSFSTYKIHKLFSVIPSNEFKNYRDKSFEIKYSVLGSSRIYSSPIKKYISLSGNAINNVDSTLTVLRKIDFINLNDKTKEIIFKKGNWELNSPLIIGKGYKVIAEPGFNLVLNQGAFIHSKSSLEFVGTKIRPIQISAMKEGMGLIVTNAKARSKIKNVNFLNLSNPKIDRWSVDGSITFNESPVTIENVNIENSRAEDSLNIVRSDFIMNNINVVNSSSDSIDLDFSSGNISNINIKNSGNDGLDLSGSNVKASDITIINSGDKALSVGEESDLIADNLNIKKSTIGLAFKDLSFGKIYTLDISNTKIGLAAFQKKSEYGGASFSINNLSRKNVEQFYLLEKDSSIKIKNNNLIPNAIDVFSIIYKNIK